MSNTLLATKLTHREKNTQNDAKTNRTRVNLTGKTFNTYRKTDGRRARNTA